MLSKSTFATLFAILASTIGAQAAGMLFQEPIAGSIHQAGGPITITWFFDPNGQTFQAQGTDNVEFHLSDLRNGANTGQLIGGPIVQSTLASGRAAGNLPQVADGTNYTIRASAGNPPTFAYSPMFTISANGNGTAAAPPTASTAGAATSTRGASPTGTVAGTPAASTRGASPTGTASAASTAAANPASINLPAWSLVALAPFAAVALV